ncbi:MAG TPA: leucyl/phenylalanyl-tRNA--protein transferase [Eoetvoesiella sp.]
MVWLDASTPLPHPSTASRDGLLAVGGDLSPARLTEAYSKGIFPWYSQGDPVLWWSPDPRMVLSCADFKVSRSLRKKLRQLASTEQSPNARMQIKLNTALPEVIKNCAGPRTTQSGTWISDEIQAAYLAWHRAGRVHSIETWIDGTLVGGLYGVCLGRFFFGESMFARMSDASKIALAYLVAFLSAQGIRHIDCQQQTGHLASLGARPLDRREFLSMVEAATCLPSAAWGRGQLLQSGELLPEGQKARIDRPNQGLPKHGQ